MNAHTQTSNRTPARPPHKVVVRSKDGDLYWREQRNGAIHGFQNAHQYDSTDPWLVEVESHHNPRHFEIAPVLEEGRYYRTRDGQHVGPMRPSESSACGPYKWVAMLPGCTYPHTGSWTEDGRFDLVHVPDHLDLIAIDPLLPLQAGVPYELRNGLITTPLIRVDVTPPRFTAYVDDRAFPAIISWDEQGRFNGADSQWDIVGHVSAEECAHRQARNRPFADGLRPGRSYVTRLGLRTSPLRASDCERLFRADIISTSGQSIIIDQSWTEHGKHANAAFDLVAEAPSPDVFGFLFVSPPCETFARPKAETPKVEKALELKLGRRYRLRNGEITEPMRPPPIHERAGQDFKFTALHQSHFRGGQWRSDGSWALDPSRPDPRDCIAEVDSLGHDKTASPPPIAITSGWRYRLANGWTTSPMCGVTSRTVNGFRFGAGLYTLGGEFNGSATLVWRADGTAADPRYNCVEELSEPVVHTGCLNLYRKGRVIVGRLYADRAEADRMHVQGNRVGCIDGFTFTEKEGQ